jgi:hypothetical protein
MSRNIISVIMYHRHKHLDLIYEKLYDSDGGIAAGSKSHLFKAHPMLATT